MKDEKDITYSDWVKYHNRIGIWCEFMRDGKPYKAEIIGADLVVHHLNKEMMSELIKEAIKNAKPIT